MSNYKNNESDHPQQLKMHFGSYCKKAFRIDTKSKAFTCKRKWLLLLLQLACVAYLLEGNNKPFVCVQYNSKCISGASLWAAGFPLLDGSLIAHVHVLFVLNSSVCLWLDVLTGQPWCQYLVKLQHPFRNIYSMFFFLFHIALLKTFHCFECHAQIQSLPSSKSDSLWNIV